ncbi:MAG: PKD domain-containing protein [Methanomicrobiaceae archaeon]|nr:PKD domain-containing protein [Methanomicrobiaceae archaeon]
MKFTVFRKGTVITLIVALALLVAPVLAGNSVTITGDVVPAAPPVADFTANPTAGTVPLMVKFSDESTGTITAWAWDFQNDGHVDSTEQHPSFFYTRSGAYTVKLTVTGPGGSDSCVKSEYITVAEKIKRPVARFRQDRHVGKTPLTVTFTDRSLNDPINYNWWFGDGSTSTEKDPMHTYTRAGIYRITLRVSNNAGSDFARSVVVVMNRWWWWWH